MVAGQIALAALSLLVLAAHFLRGANLVLVVAVLVVAGLLAVRRPWAARVVQLTLVLGAVEWVRTLVVLAAARARAGEPVARLVLILGSVAIVTALAALAFQGRRLRRVYRLNDS